MTKGMLDQTLKAVCVALVFGVSVAPGAAVAGEEVKVSTGKGYSRISACAEAKRRATASGVYPDFLSLYGQSGTVVSIGDCECGKTYSDLWECIVVYVVRKPD